MGRLSMIHALPRLFKPALCNRTLESRIDESSNDKEQQSKPHSAFVWTSELEVVA